jgi:hypothetical protein
MERAPRDPQFLEEANALLQAASEKPASSFLDLSAETLVQEDKGFQRHLYRSFLRAIATARAHDRNQVKNRGHFLPEIFNEAWGRELKSKKLARIALDQNISFLARQHALVTEAERSFHERWEELQGELYADQQPYAMDLIASLQKAPRSVQYTDREGNLKHKNIFGVTAIAPMGAGKSHLIEMCTTVIADSAIDRHLVLVVPSLTLQQQLLTKFRKDLPHLRIGALSGEVADDPSENELMIITVGAFNAHFRNNALQGQPIDMIMIDEAHHLTQPEFKQTWLEHWNGHTMGFTATPAYNLDKDARALLPHIVEHTNAMELIEAGRLNDGQIFTFLIDDELLQELAVHYGVELTKSELKVIVREILDSLVIDFVKPLIEEGRKGIIFCEPGDEAWNARELARRLEEDEGAKLSGGRSMRAAAMYSKGKNQHDILRRYREGELDIITTIDTGRESLDAEFNFVILNTSIDSRLSGRQKVGRGMRPNKQFGVTIYAQLINNITSLVPVRHNPFLIEEAFGQLPATFQQGRTLRSGPKESKPRTPQATPHEQPPEGVDISKLEPILQTILQRFDRRPIGESLRSGRQDAWILEGGLQPLHKILLGYNITEKRAMKILRAEGYMWRGKYEELDGRRRLVYYYGPEAIEYLRSKLPSGRAFNKEEAAAHLGISVRLFEYIESQPANAIEGKELVRPGRITAICYTEDTMALAEIALKKIPGMQPGDRPIREVAAEMDVSEAHIRSLLGIQDSKRYHVNKAFHLTQDEIAEAKRIFYSLPDAADTDKNLTAITEATGVQGRTIKRELEPEEQSLGEEKKYVNKQGRLLHGIMYPQEVWEPLQERLIKKYRSRQLEAHIILLNKKTLKSIVRNGSKQDIEEVAKTLASQGYTVEPITVVGNKDPSLSIEWPAVAALQREYGAPRRATKHGLIIDFSRLPVDSGDLNPAKIAYAQEIQKYFLRDDQLKTYDSPDLP